MLWWLALVAIVLGVVWFARSWGFGNIFIATSGFVATLLALLIGQAGLAVTMFVAAIFIALGCLSYSLLYSLKNKGNEEKKG